METRLIDYGEYLTLQSKTGADAGKEFDELVARIKNTNDYKYIVTVDNNEHTLTIDGAGNFLLTPPVEKQPGF